LLPKRDTKIEYTTRLLLRVVALYWFNLSLLTSPHPVLVMSKYL